MSARRPMKRPGKHWIYGVTSCTVTSGLRGPGFNFSYHLGSGCSTAVEPMPQELKLKRSRVRFLPGAGLFSLSISQ